MKTIDGFEAAMERADHLIRLYDFLHDTRSRRVRSDWAEKFKQLMHWPAGEQIRRVDGKNRESILILRQVTGIDNKHFTHDYLSELLRGSVVAIVSALDRYIHDLVVENSWKLLQRHQDKIPNELKKMHLPILATKRALERLRKSQFARPGTLVKQAIQEQLHREFTFQKPDSILLAAQMLGVKEFWAKVGSRMAGTPAANKVVSTLREIADRRNQIVHEADQVRKTKAKEITLRDIDDKAVRRWVAWIRDFARAVDKVVSAAV